MRLDGSSKTLTVRDCFKEYCRKEVLDGDNKPVSDAAVHTCTCTVDWEIFNDHSNVKDLTHVKLPRYIILVIEILCR